jgi:hypothetical protein
MDEQAFYAAIKDKAVTYNLNPLLLLSGIEGLYSFKDVTLDAVNYPFLDNLILTIFALRVGDSFHTIAEKNLQSIQAEARTAAELELFELSPDYVAASSNTYLQSFAQVLNGKTTIRKYHEKALEVAALEIKNAQQRFQNFSIGSIIFNICMQPGEGLDLSFIFSN